MIISFLVFVFALFLVLGAYLLATHGTDKKRARLQKRLSEALLHSAHTEDVDVVLARSELMSEIPWVNRTMISLQAALHLKRMLDQADLHITPSRLIMFSVMAGLLGGLAASVLTIFIPIMILAGLVCAAIPFGHVWWKRKKRFDAFLEQLPDALDLISRALSAGHAFSEALHMVSIEMPHPIAAEFRKAYEEQNLGLSVKLALENLTQRMPILDLKTLTTSSRMSAWLLCGLPIFVALAVTVMNPEYMSVLWKNPRGHYLIAIAIFMQISGMLIVRKILKIKI